MHRCAEAGIVIVPDLAFLDDVDTLVADVERVVSYVYIVLLGELVATETQLAAVAGDPRRLSKERCVSHIAASGALKAKAEIWIDPALKRNHRDVFRAFRRVARVTSSGCSLSTQGAPGRVAVVFRNLRDVVLWTRSVRRVENVLGAKAFTVDGVALQPLARTADPLKLARKVLGRIRRSHH